MTEQEFKNRVAEILKDKIHFSPQLESYVIHGALDEIWQLHTSETQTNKAASSQQVLTDKEIENLVAIKYPYMPVAQGDYGTEQKYIKNRSKVDKYRKGFIAGYKSK